MEMGRREVLLAGDAPAIRPVGEISFDRLQDKNLSADHTAVDAAEFLPMPPTLRVRVRICSVRPAPFTFVDDLATGHAEAGVPAYAEDQDLWQKS